MKIREAIADGSFAFVACFSEASEARDVSGQREELTLAIDQLRMRRPGDPWLLPVRLDDVSIPDVDLGGGRTLRNIQYIDLFGDRWETGTVKLATAVVRILGSKAPLVAPETQLPKSGTQAAAAFRSALRDPNGDIAVHDHLAGLSNLAYEALTDEARFPVSSEKLHGAKDAAAVWVADLVDEQMAVLDPLTDALVETGAWGLPIHDASLTEAIARVGQARRDAGGMTILIQLHHFPVVAAVYSVGLAAVRRGNFHALKAALVDPQIRDLRDGRLPLVARFNPWRAFSEWDIPPNVLARRIDDQDVTPEAINSLMTRGGKRHTPISDYLHIRLRDPLRALIPDDLDYDETFDRFEIFSALLAVDAKRGKSGSTYFDPAYVGRWIWRHRHGGLEQQPERQMQAELEADGGRWPPLVQGLFGGSVVRAKATFEQFIADAAARRQRY